MSIEITREIARKVRDTVDAGLVSGMGIQEPGHMCVEAAVCYALGLPHGDDPGCVAQSLRALKIRLNDSAWSSDQARAKGLRRLALAQLGSAGVLDEQEFRSRVVDLAIRKSVPRALRSAASVLTRRGHAGQAAKLESAAVRCETEGTREACESARALAMDAAERSARGTDYAAAYAAADAAAAAYAAADAADAAYAAADAAYAAAYAAADAADAAYAAADAAADAARARDRALAEYAEGVVQILIDLKAPGCQCLDLVPLEAA